MVICLTTLTMSTIFYLGDVTHLSGCRNYLWEVTAMEAELLHFLKLQGYSLCFIPTLRREEGTIYFLGSLLADLTTIMGLTRFSSFLYVHTLIIISTFIITMYSILLNFFISINCFLLPLFLFVVH